MTDIPYIEADKQLGDALDYLENNDLTPKEDKEFNQLLIIVLRVLLKKIDSLENMVKLINQLNNSG